MNGIVEARVLLTQKIKRWIRSALTNKLLEEDVKTKLKSYISTPDGDSIKSIPFSLVKSVHECIQADNGSILFRSLLIY